MSRSKPFRSLYDKLNPRRLYSQLLEDMTAQGHLSVLDIGCGFDTPTLAKLRGYRVGIDLVPGFVPSDGVVVLRASGEHLPFAPGTFDLVCCRSVLEHVETPELLFREVARVLRPGGTFLVLTPNKWDYVSLLAAAIPNGLHPWLVRVLTGRTEDRTFPTIYRANTRGALQRISSDAGLVVESILLCRQQPHYLQINPVLYTLGVAVEQVLQRPFSALRPWILATFRAPDASVTGQTRGKGV